jgi:hypothetical protein
MQAWQIHALNRLQCLPSPGQHKSGCTLKTAFADARLICLRCALTIVAALREVKHVDRRRCRRPLNLRFFAICPNVISATG